MDFRVQLPVEERSSSGDFQYRCLVRFNFYRGSWVNRLLTRNKFGHINFQIRAYPDSQNNDYLINYSRVPSLAGNLRVNEYPWTADAYVEFVIPWKRIREINIDASSPMTIRSLFKRNCCRAAAYLLTGNPDRLDVVRKIAECL